MNCRAEKRTRTKMKRGPAVLSVTAAVLSALAGVVAWSPAAGAQTTPNVKYWGTSDGGVFRVTKPAQLPLSGTVKQVATSNGAWYVVKANGTVWAWGAGQHGQLGNGHTTSTRTPVEVAFPAGVSIAFMADVSPYDTALAVDTTGRAWGWGYNLNGQLCKGDTRLRAAPVKLPFTGVTALSGAGDHALYVSNGNLYACGDNGYGDLGIGTKRPSHVPVQVPLSGVTAVTSAWRTSGALVGGTYYSWGWNGMGAVGDGSTANALKPVKVSLPAPVATLRLGGGGPLNGQTLALLTDGTMWAWGADSYGQLGDGQTNNKTSPEKITTPASYVAVESNGETSFAIDSSGRLWAWGSNRHDQLGNGQKTTQLTPIVLATGAHQVSATAGDAEVLF
jgi:alpha-tubulin suppressor-like RCC1 family protein